MWVICLPYFLLSEEKKSERQSCSHYSNLERLLHEPDMGFLTHRITTLNTTLYINAEQKVQSQRLLKVPPRHLQPCLDLK